MPRYCLHGHEFTGFAYNPLNRSAALAGLRKLPGQVSVLVLANGASVRADATHEEGLMTQVTTLSGSTMQREVRRSR
jgi:hypothetical protein